MDFERLVCGVPKRGFGGGCGNNDGYCILAVLSGSPWATAK